MIDALMRRLGDRAAARIVNRLTGHDWEPGAYPIHFSTCPRGLGTRVLLRRTDWRALAAHPLP